MPPGWKGPHRCNLRKAEVKQLGVAALGKEDVGRLDVAMGNSLLRFFVFHRCGGCGLYRIGALRRNRTIRAATLAEGKITQRSLLRHAVEHTMAEVLVVLVTTILTNLASHTFIDLLHLRP